MTTVSQVMTRDVRVMSPRDSLVQAAQTMDALNVGAIPVCDGDTLVGMVTDRDLVVRGLAQNCPPDSTPLSAVMSQDASCCYEDQTIDDVATEMRHRQIRRLPVVDRDEHVVGMVSLGDLATKDDGTDTAADTLKAVSTPSVPDR